jgi:hypothetical protein
MSEKKPAPKPTETVTRTRTGVPETQESLRSKLAEQGRGKRPS